MPFVVCPDRRFPMLCSITDNAGPFKKTPSTLFPMLLLLIIALSACATENLDEVRAANPTRTDSFETPYDILSMSAKQRFEMTSWFFGDPTIHWRREKGHPMIRVYAIYSRTTLFDITFEQVQSDRTLVKYRHGNDGHGIQDQTWGIIVSCNQQGLAPVK
ncbi:MAG: hypothetical protein ABIU05_11165 [Nitrospirales bacterium]